MVMQKLGGGALQQESTGANDYYLLGSSFVYAAGGWMEVGRIEKLRKAAWLRR